MICLKSLFMGRKRRVLFSENNFSALFCRLQNKGTDTFSVSPKGDSGSVGNTHEPLLISTNNQLITNPAMYGHGTARSDAPFQDQIGATIEARNKASINHLGYLYCILEQYIRYLSK